MFVELKTVPQSWRMPYNVKTLTGHKYRVVHPAKNKLIQKAIRKPFKKYFKRKKASDLSYRKVL